MMATLFMLTFQLPSPQNACVRRVLCVSQWLVPCDAEDFHFFVLIPGQDAFTGFVKLCAK